MAQTCCNFLQDLGLFFMLKIVIYFFVGIRIDFVGNTHDFSWTYTPTSLEYIFFVGLTHWLSWNSMLYVRPYTDFVGIQPFRWTSHLTSLGNSTFFAGLTPTSLEFHDFTFETFTTNYILKQKRQRS